MSANAAAVLWQGLKLLHRPSSKTRDLSCDPCLPLGAGVLWPLTFAIMLFAMCSRAWVAACCGSHLGAADVSLRLTGTHGTRTSAACAGTWSVAAVNIHDDASPRRKTKLEPKALCSTVPAGSKPCRQPWRAVASSSIRARQPTARHRGEQWVPPGQLSPGKRDAPARNVSASSTWN